MLPYLGSPKRKRNMAVTEQFKQDVLEVLDEYTAALENNEGDDAIPVLTAGEIDRTVSLPAVKYNTDPTTDPSATPVDYRKVPMATLWNRVEAIASTAEESIEGTAQLAQQDIAVARQQAQQAVQAAQQAAEQSIGGMQGDVNEALATVNQRIEALDQMHHYMPIVGENQNWWVYDADQMKYVDSGRPAKMGILYIDFEYDYDTGTLLMEYLDSEGEDSIGKTMNFDDGDLIIDITSLA